MNINKINTALKSCCNCLAAAGVFLSVIGGILPSQAIANTRQLKFIYTGSGSSDTVQLVDSTPGGQADVYHKDIKFSITWVVSISGSSIIKINKPTVKITGSGSAHIPHLNVECHGGVDEPHDAKGKKYAPITIRVVKASKNFLEILIPEIPLGWSEVSGCDAADKIEPHLTTQDELQWYKDLSLQTYKIALKNNFKVTPASYGNIFPFGPSGDQISFDWRWNNTLKIVPH